MGTGPTVLMLHGWGSNKDTFDPISMPLSEHYKIISLSLPGFGLSPEPSTPWSVEDYTELVRAFMAEVAPGETYDCICHSYGGRIAAKLREYKNLVVIGGAGIKPRRSLWYYIRLYNYKMIKMLASVPVLGAVFRRPHIALRNLRSSSDYSQATPTMRATLALAVNHDQKKDYAQIQVPTLLIWGEKDEATPLRDGQLINRIVKDSILLTHPGMGHFVFSEAPQAVAKQVLQFLKGGQF